MKNVWDLGASSETLRFSFTSLDWVRPWLTRPSRPRPRSDAPLAGFAWGRNGLAARELARSLIEEATGSSALAERHCRELTHSVIARLPALGFELTREDVLGCLEAEAQAA